MSLALAPKLLAKVTRPELRPAFKDRGDGFSAIDFHLYGTTRDPQTDLLSRVAKAAATEAIKGQLDRLFKKKDSSPQAAGRSRPRRRPRPTRCGASACR